jgi:RND family efflux transporter MFP subunit
MYRALCLFFMATGLLLAANTAVAEERKEGAGGPPPMLVTATEIVNGKSEPTANFVGTLYFARTAEVAAEVDGIVLQTYVNDGATVKAGDRLIRLDDDLLQTEIAGTRATFEQNQIDIEQAQKDYNRFAALSEQKSVAISEFETYDTKLNRLKKLSTVLEARLDRLLLEQKKKTVRAPFDGLIIEKLVEAGEWVKAGGTVVTLADNRSFEAHVDIPSGIVPFLTPGKEVELTIAGQEKRGEFTAIIPRGDISTRTFIAKFTLAASTSLIEGMEAQVTLPTAEAIEGLLVPRDALINSFGQNVIFINNNNQAKMVAVEVTGHSGTLTGIIGDGIEAGQMVIVKGSERIRDGQSVRTE